MLILCVMALFVAVYSLQPPWINILVLSRSTVQISCSDHGNSAGLTRIYRTADAEFKPIVKIVNVGNECHVTPDVALESVQCVCVKTTRVMCNISDSQNSQDIDRWKWKCAIYPNYKAVFSEIVHASHHVPMSSTTLSLLDVISDTPKNSFITTEDMWETPLSENVTSGHINLTSITKDIISKNLSLNESERNVVLSPASDVTNVSLSSDDQADAAQSIVATFSPEEVAVRHSSLVDHYERIPTMFISLIAESFPLSQDPIPDSVGTGSEMGQALTRVDYKQGPSTSDASDEEESRLTNRQDESCPIVTEEGLYESLLRTRTDDKDQDITVATI